MYSCEITSIRLFKTKNHIDVCTALRANFFHSHVKPSFFSHGKNITEGQPWLT